MRLVAALALIIASGLVQADTNVVIGSISHHGNVTDDNGNPYYEQHLGIGIEQPVTNWLYIHAGAYFDSSRAPAFYGGGYRPFRVRQWLSLNITLALMNGGSFNQGRLTMIAYPVIEIKNGAFGINLSHVPSAMLPGSGGITVMQYKLIF